ncbi:jg22813 [Pararge aegeria aegeria]|uniref:Jg22813 protein n=1 Tax=Pararge aegeria aegeria TaxID=348720 RepID=A0A8S4RY59_9NEOP|nr:jg22813 [Pararge aegeria aegeria]
MAVVVPWTSSACPTITNIMQWSAESAVAPVLVTARGVEPSISSSHNRSHPYSTSVVHFGEGSGSRNGEHLRAHCDARPASPGVIDEHFHT